MFKKTKGSFDCLHDVWPENGLGLFIQHHMSSGVNLVHSLGDEKKFCRPPKFRNLGGDGEKLTFLELNN